MISLLTTVIFIHARRLDALLFSELQRALWLTCYRSYTRVHNVSVFIEFNGGHHGNNRTIHEDHLTDVVTSTAHGKQCRITKPDDQ